MRYVLRTRPQWGRNSATAIEYTVIGKPPAMGDVVAAGLQRLQGVRAPLTQIRSGLGSLGDDDPTNPIDPVSAAANAPTITTTADPQVAYTACLAGGGSFASCNQIPGVTPDMIAAAKAKAAQPTNLLSSITSDPTKLAIAGGALVGLYLLFRKKKR